MYKKDDAQRKQSHMQEDQRKLQELWVLQDNMEIKPRAEEENQPLPDSAENASNLNTDWETIVKDYKEKYKKQPIIHEGHQGLTFSSDEEAFDFFEEQAKTGRSFHGEKCIDGVATGIHLFSCGDGTLYKGKLSEIQSELQTALKKKSENEKTRAGLEQINKLVTSQLNAGYRKSMKEIRTPQQQSQLQIPEPEAPSPGK